MVTPFHTGNLHIWYSKTYWRGCVYCIKHDYCITLCNKSKGNATMPHSSWPWFITIVVEFIHILHNFWNLKPSTTMLAKIWTPNQISCWTKVYGKTWEGMGWNMWKNLKRHDPCSHVWVVFSMAISGTDWLEVPTLYKVYVKENPLKIWSYMVQYLHFRILNFPLFFFAAPW